MGTPTFELALLWDVTSSPITVQEVIESLDSHFPGSKVSKIAVVLSPATACLHFFVDFSLYARNTLAQLDSDVKKSGGRFIEVLRIPEDKREAFKAQFLLSASGAPSSFKHLKDCARPIQEHLTKLASGIQKAQLLRPTAPAAAPRPSQRPRQAPRFSCNLEVEFQTNNGLVREHAMDISKGGIFVRTSQRPELYSELGLKIWLPNGLLLQTTARVSHHLEQPAPGGVGLTFRRGDPVFTRLLERYFSPFSPTQKK